MTPQKPLVFSVWPPLVLHIINNLSCCAYMPDPVGVSLAEGPRVVGDDVTAVA